MANADRGVSPSPLLKKQESHRLSHDLRAPEHDRVRPVGVDTFVDQKFSNSQGCARHETRKVLRQEPCVDWMESIDILERIYGLDDGPLVYRPWQRQLDKDPMNGRILVEPIDRRE